MVDDLHLTVPLLHVYVFSSALIFRYLKNTATIECSTVKHFVRLDTKDLQITVAIRA